MLDELSVDLVDVLPHAAKLTLHNKATAIVDNCLSFIFSPPLVSHTLQKVLLNVAFDDNVANVNQRIIVFR